MSDSLDRDVAVFTEALLVSDAERATFLDRACGGDGALRQRVEALLQAHGRAGDFLEEPLVQPGVGGKPPVSIGEKPGNRIGRYKLLQQIGEGGCGVVFMAEQAEPVRRLVALKIIKPGMDTRSVIARFEAERQALALMDHPNIAKVFDAGATESGRPYVVMELIRGIKITDYCDQNSLPTAERLKLFIQVCHAVQHAHQKGVIHRDIKPSNILVTATVEGAALPVVIDFGIAKATTNQRLTDKTLFTAFEMLIGTPAYMSPEQAALTGADVDTRTDIYSLGVLLYELLTGSTPFDTGQLLQAGLDEIRRVIREQEPVCPSTRLSKLTQPDLTAVASHRQSEPPKLIRAICGDLDWIAMKALEKDRTRRYATANGLALDVQRFLANETISARSPSKLYKFQKTVLRNRFLFLGLASGTLLLIVSLVVVSTSLSKERQARREADAALKQAEADKAQAKTEAAKSRQVTQFLEDMLQGVGPSAALGRDTVMLREILDRTAERVGPELANQPAVEAELRALIGRLYLEIGHHDQAESMHRAALAIRRRLSGQESVEAAASLNDLGQALWKQRKLVEAEAAHQEALTIRRRLLGNTHPEVASSLNNLANVYRRQRKLPQAEALAREGLELRRRRLGEEHLDVADSLRSLSIILGDEGKRVEAEATAREMLAMRRRLLGNEHILVAAALADVAWAAGFTGKPDEAEALEGEVLVMQRKLLGDGHQDVAKTVASLGERMRQRGDLAGAHGVLRAALSIQRKLLGAAHPDTLVTVRSLAWTCETEGLWAEAEALYREVVSGLPKPADGTAPPGLREIEGLARSLIGQKKFQEAEKTLAETLTPGFARMPESAKLRAARVELFGRQGRWQEAAEDAVAVVEYQPPEHYQYHTLAPLLVITGNRPAYRKLCQQILPAYADTTSSYVAERMGKDCLLWPDSGVDLPAASRLAEKAVTLDVNYPGMPYSQVAKALAEYRLARFSGAAEWARKPLEHPEVNARSHAHAVLAMALWQLGQPDPARAVLAQGEALAISALAGGDEGKIGGAWVAWLCARISLDEAVALIRPVPATQKTLNPP